jgi:hypothetical protein
MCPFPTPPLLRNFGLKSDCKEGRILGTEISNFKSVHIHNINTSDISAQTILIHRNKIYTYVFIPHTSSPQKYKSM